MKEFWIELKYEYSSHLWCTLYHLDRKGYPIEPFVIRAKDEEEAIEILNAYPLKIKVKGFRPLSLLGRRFHLVELK